MYEAQRNTATFLCLMMLLHSFGHQKWTQDHLFTLYRWVTSILHPKQCSLPAALALNKFAAVQNFHFLIQWYDSSCLNDPIYACLMIFNINQILQSATTTRQDVWIFYSWHQVWNQHLLISLFRHVSCNLQLNHILLSAATI